VVIVNICANFFGYLCAMFNVVNIFVNK